jgi:steroid 5-alpha reductase family enzyme
MTMDIFSPLLANVLLASLLWIFATWKKDVSLVDLLWPLFFVLSAWIWFDPNTAGFVQWAVLMLVMVWGARLHIHLARRNLGHGEDRRYQEIRKNNNPGFWWKSYFIVFVLQAVLAWLAALAIYGALQGDGFTWCSLLGLVVGVFGLLYEAVADWQLSRFKSDSANRGLVMNRGLWRLSRHPNYFGECCFWWGIYFLGLPAGWWTIVSPLLLTVLLLRVSGVSLLEKDIHERRPGYLDYIRQTPAFFPDFSRAIGGDKK